MIRALNLTIARGGQIICHNLDLVARDGEIVGVVGPNGSGKTTLMLALHRVLRATSGRVVIDDQDLIHLTRRQIAQQIAVVAQERDTALPLSVRDCVALGRLASTSLLNYGGQPDQELITAALTKVELEDLGDRLITQLSGGERQRVLIARAIVQQATHLLLDEPTNHLDLRHQFALLDLVRSLECTTVMVLHDLNLAARCCDRIVLLDGGRIAAAGTPAEVLCAEILQPVYRLQVDSIEHRGRIHLLFDSQH